MGQRREYEMAYKAVTTEIKQRGQAKSCVANKKQTQNKQKVRNWQSTPCQLCIFSDSVIPVSTKQREQKQWLVQA